MVPGVSGEVLTPTTVFFADGPVLVGKKAQAAGILQPDRYAECVKRDMGNPLYSKPLRGKFVPPEVIQAFVLRKLRNDIKRVVPDEYRVVITVPAFFDEPRRKATADTGEMAGMDVLDIVNEPTAAALAFGEELGYLTGNGTVRERIKVLVYDLGGGTFDATVVEMKPDEIRTLATDGDVHLGGRDWDQRLVDHLAEEFIRTYREDPRTNPIVLQRLLVEVDEAKRRLSKVDKTEVVVDHAGMTMRTTIDRMIFEELTEDLLARTAFTTSEVLRAASLDWSDLSRILLCGGEHACLR